MNIIFKSNVTPHKFSLFAAAAFTCLSMSACGQPENQPTNDDQQKEQAVETETLLVCEGYTTSLMAGMGGKEQETFIITKTGDRITKVKTQHFTYTLEKADANTKNNSHPIYNQLIVEPEKLILRTENTESKNTVETIIYNNNSYKKNLVFSRTEGQCTVTNKAF